MTDGRRPRIAINALSARIGGGITYARNLLGIFDQTDRAEIFVLGGPIQRELLPEGNYTFVDCAFAARSVLHRTLWERFGVSSTLRRLEADLYYVLSGLMPAPPPPGCRSVVALRNMLPFSPVHRKMYPHGYMRGRLWLIGRAQRRSFALADLVILVSEYGRRVVDTSIPERRGRTVVIPHGVGGSFTDESEAPTRWPEGYVLYVSTVDVYKAHLEVVESWAALRARRATGEKLVIAGPEYPWCAKRVRRRIAELGLEGEVLMLGHVPHDELPALYHNAKLNVFASLCENCPNILLEALGSGSAVLCSDAPPMPEFGSDAVLYFDPTRPEQLAGLLTELLDDESALAELAAKARQRSREFPLEVSLRTTWRHLLELAESAAALPKSAS